MKHKAFYFLIIAIVISLTGCNNNIKTKKAKTSPSVDQKDKTPAETDAEVLAKLWPSSNFYKLKQYRFRSLENAYASPDSVINLALYAQDMNALPETIDTFKYVQLLGLDHNNLGTLPDEVGNLRYLQKIHLNKNSFTAFPEVLAKNKYLKTILISDNQIESVTPDLKNLVYLEELVMNDNKLGTVPEAIFELKELKVLGLRNNGIGMLPDKFENLPNLEKLNLQGNNLKEVPESLTMLPLQRLTLKGNPMDYAYVKQLAEKMPETEIEF
ncbi:MAG: leucine-rich repeat domain-containing protein [Bacteroidota bacterium]